LSLRNPQIAIIGAGKLACSLTDALIKNNFKINIVVSKNRSSASQLAKKNKIESCSNLLKDIPVSINIFFLTVPDDQIHFVANQLAKLNFNFRKSVFVHCSGVKNVSALKALQDKKANTASFHIMQTFSSKQIVKMNNCFAAIETQSKTARKFLMDLANKIKLNAISLSSDKKVGYHLSGVFASNFLVSNIFQADVLLNKIKKGKSSFEIVCPIIYSALRNIKSKGTIEALSGPINRGDLETIKIHSSFLKMTAYSNKRQSRNYLYLSYLVQTLNLLEILRSKKKKFSLKQEKIEKFLINELIIQVNLLRSKSK